MDAQWKEWWQGEGGREQFRAALLSATTRWQRDEASADEAADVIGMSIPSGRGRAALLRELAREIRAICPVALIEEVRQRFLVNRCGGETLMTEARVARAVAAALAPTA